MKSISRLLMILEPAILLYIIARHWGPGLDRLDALLWMLPVLGLRLLVYRRLWTRTPLDGVLAVLVLLMLINLQVAPYQYTWWDWVISRPLMGILIYTSLVEWTRRTGSLRGVLLLSVVLALWAGLIALGASQWTSKSYIFLPLTDVLPRLNWVPGVGGGFNVNEIAGAMAWLAPLMGALAVLPLRVSTPDATRLRGGRTIRFLAGLAFLYLITALMLGQSRFALAGVIPALGLVIGRLVPRGRARNAAWIALGLYLALELVVVSNVLNPNAAAMSARDQDSAVSRLAFWESALAMVSDHPLTGVGMNMFRFEAVRERYPVAGWNFIPHAHNELVQITTDLGIPGLLVFLSLYAGAGFMLWRAWRQGDAITRAVAVGAAAGLFAHAVYGMGDANPLWDRLAFIFWWILGVSGSAYVHAIHRHIADGLSSED